MRYSLEKINQIKQLRLNGCSILRIMSELNLPKTTVWHHVKDIQLTDSQVRILKSNQGGSKIKKELNIQKANAFARELLSGELREPLIIIAMLYWAEGRKADRCEFINSDGQMIDLYLKILRNILKVPEEYIEITIRIFTGMNQKECVSYWKKITNVDKTRTKVKFNDGGTRGNTKYGLCRVTIKKSHQMLKLMHSLIGLISQNTLPS